MKYILENTSPVIGLTYLADIFGIDSEDIRDEFITYAEELDGSNVYLIGDDPDPYITSGYAILFATDHIRRRMQPAEFAKALTRLTSTGRYATELSIEEIEAGAWQLDLQNVDSLENGELDLEEFCTGYLAELKAMREETRKEMDITLEKIFKKALE